MIRYIRLYYLRSNKRLNSLSLSPELLDRLNASVIAWTLLLLDKPSEPTDLLAIRSTVALRYYLHTI